jgi:hypothetical protein
MKSRWPEKIIPSPDEQPPHDCLGFEGEGYRNGFNEALTLCTPYREELEAEIKRLKELLEKANEKN